LRIRICSAFLKEGNLPSTPFTAGFPEDPL
jgi:hypothetical protein